MRKTAKGCLHANTETSIGRVKTGMEKFRRLLRKYIMNCKLHKFHIPVAE
jgi:hypothetical protein